MGAHFRLRRVVPAWGATVLLAFGGVLASFAVSQAQPTGPARAVSLEWTVPEACPDIEYVEHEIGRLLAGAATPITPLLHARAEVKRGGETDWLVVLETDSSEGVGRRTFSAESCRAAADATALILALAVDPDRVATNQSAPAASASALPATSAGTSTASNGAPSASAAPTSGLPPFETATAASAPPPPPPPPPMYIPPAFGFSLAISGAFDMGTLPASSPGVFASGGFIARRLQWIRFDVGAGIFANEAASVAGFENGVFRLRVFDAGVCVLPLTGRFELGGCVDGELSWEVATGVNEASTSTHGATWLVLRPRATFAYAFSRTWALRADASIGYAVDAPPQFVVLGSDSIEEVQIPGVWTGRISLGLEARF